MGLGHAYSRWLRKLAEGGHDVCKYRLQIVGRLMQDFETVVFPVGKFARLQSGHVNREHQSVGRIP